MTGDGWRRYLAPAAFLLAATIAVVLIRAGLENGSKTTAPTRPVATTTKPVRRFWVVRAGDTLVIISKKTHVPVKTIKRLNPKVTSTSLFIGQRIRVR